MAGFKILDQWPTPSGTPIDLAWDGEFLWSVDLGTSTIYKHDPDDGTVLASFAAPDTQPLGLTYDGSHLWVSCRGTSQKIYRITTTGSVVSSFDAPGTGSNRVRGLAWDGAHLWMGDIVNDVVYRIDPSDGSVLDTIDFPEGSIGGLTWDGKYLWATNDSPDRLYRLVDPGNETWESFPAPSEQPIGLAFDGTHLWNSDLTDDVVYKLDMESMSEVFDASTTWTAPTDVEEAVVELWGPGGDGAGTATGGGGGGGGGAYARSAIPVTPGNDYDIVVGEGGSETPSTFDTNVVEADAGQNAFLNIGGQGGQASASTGDVKFSGGKGADDSLGSIPCGGGGSAFRDGNGQDGTTTTGGDGEGPGGDPRQDGTAPGGGGGGGIPAGNGADGRAIITYSLLPSAATGQAHIAATSTITATGKAVHRSNPASVSATGSITAAGKVSAKSAASISAQGAISASGSRIRRYHPGQPLRWLGGPIDVRVEIDTGLAGATFGIWDQSAWGAASWGAQDPDWADISEYVQRVSIDRGKERWEQRFGAGVAQIVLDNTRGYFTPEVAGPFHLPFRPGRRIRVVALPDPTDPLHKVPLFTGFIDSSNDSYDGAGWNISTVLNCVDFMGLWQANDPLATTATGVQTTSARVHAALDRVGLSGWPNDLRDVQGGIHTMQSSDLAQPTAEECQRAAEAEGGAFFCSHDGKATFRYRDWLSEALSDNTIAHDAATEQAATIGSTQFNHTPSGTPKGVLVYIFHVGGLTATYDVTYGGVPLTRIGYGAFSGGTNAVRAIAYFLGSNVPPGTQEVSVTEKFGGERPAHIVCVTVTANSDQIRVADVVEAGAPSTANPQVTLGSGSQSALRYVGVMSGLSSPSDLTPLSGQSVVHTHDFGSTSSRVDRRSGSDTGSVTVGYTAAAANYAVVGVALTGDLYTRSTEVQGYLGYDDAELDADDRRAPVLDMKVSWELARVRNDIQFSRVGGSIQHKWDDTSIAAFGRRSYRRLDLYNNSDDQVALLAERALEAWKDNRLRVDAVTIGANADPNNEDVNRLLWDTQFGDLLAVKVKPPYGWDYEKQVHVMGIRHEITSEDWTVTFMLDDAATFQG